MPVFKAGNYAAPGEIVPRGFPAVLAKGDTRFKQGSGRLELADRIFSDAPGLAARVIVNRVWGWHFGQGLVATAERFRHAGEKPTNPELLEDLAARFIEHGWSLKWLNKEIMLSAVYQQSSNAARGRQPRPTKPMRCLWRQNPRRLDVEAYRDTLVRAAGLLNEEMGGAAGRPRRRHVLSASDLRARQPRALARVLALFDFPDRDADDAGTRRHHDDAAADFHDERRVRSEPCGGWPRNPRRRRQERPSKSPACIAAFSRATRRRLRLKSALEYLKKGTLQRYAQVLLSTNEEIFLP